MVQRFQLMTAIIYEKTHPFTIATTSTVTGESSPVLQRIKEVLQLHLQKKKNSNVNTTRSNKQPTFTFAAPNSTLQLQRLGETAKRHGRITK